MKKAEIMTEITRSRNQVCSTDFLAAGRDRAPPKESRSLGSVSIELCAGTHKIINATVDRKFRFDLTTSNAPSDLMV